MGLNAEEIKETVESMWRNLYKLARTFYNVPGSKRVAETVRGKVDKFRQYIPVLEAICNPGLKERHWREVFVQFLIEHFYSFIKIYLNYYYKMNFLQCNLD